MVFLRATSLFICILLASLFATAQNIDSFRKCHGCTDAELKTFFDQNPRPYEAFVLEPAEATDRVAVLFHGLSDSPYYLKDMAQFLYKNGFRVVVPLLKGHGNDYAGLEKVTSGEWLEQGKDIVRQVSALGNTLVVGGFSNGALVASQIATDPELKPRITSLLLLSPALRLPLTSLLVGKVTQLLASLNRIVKLATSQNLFSAFLKFKVLKNNCTSCVGAVRYADIPVNGLFQVHNGIKSLNRSVSDSHITVPTFMALSSMDEAIDVQKITKFFSKNFRGPKHLFWIESSVPQVGRALPVTALPIEEMTVIKTSERVTHSGVSLVDPGLAKPTERNPLMNEMQNSILDQFFRILPRSCKAVHR